MLDIKKSNIFLAMAGAAVLMASSPVLAQDAAAPAPATTEAAAPAATPAAPVAEAPAPAEAAAEE